MMKSVFIGLIGGTLMAGVIVSILKYTNNCESEKQKLEHVIELLEEAREERHLYRDLSMMLYRQQTDKEEKEAYKVVDDWLKENRDCVNIKFGIARVKGNKVKVEIGK